MSEKTSNVDRNGTLAQGRVEVLAEDPAGGHAIGAPATREEERALAREVLRFRALAAGARTMGIQWIDPAPSSPTDPPLVAVPWLVRRADVDPPGRWYGVPAESSADAAEVFAAEWCGPALSPRIDRQWEVTVEVADSPKGPMHRYLVRCEMRVRCTASRA